MAKLTQLIPAPELPPGQIGAIRNSIIYGDRKRGLEGLLDRAAREIKVSKDSLIVRNIRPQSDLDWCSNTDYSTAVTTDIWPCTVKAVANDYKDIITSASTVMADQRFVAIYGLRDSRFAIATPIAQTTSLFKFNVGHSDKAIWDITKCYSYRSKVVGISPSAIVIPQNTYFQISGYLFNNSAVASYISLIGLVVEPRGQVISP
jgi:hypothetical protein